MKLSARLEDNSAHFEQLLAMFTSEMDRDGHKRWLRWFACWCAWQVVHITSKSHVHAIYTAQRYARGMSNEKHLYIANTKAKAAIKTFRSSDAASYAAKAALATTCLADADAAGMAALCAAWTTETSAELIAIERRIQQMMLRIVRRIERIKAKQ
jgi:hypothetical protein